VSGDDGLAFEVDPLLEVEHSATEMIIGEVKEGPAGFNRSTLRAEVVRVALARFGCCSLDHAPELAGSLLTSGEAWTPSGHRVRLMAFGSSADRIPPRAKFISLAHLVDYLTRHLHDHWEAFSRAQFKDPVLHLLSVLEKARVGDAHEREVDRTQ
jgi:hypothetical protein